MGSSDLPAAPRGRPPIEIERLIVDAELLRGRRQDGLALDLERAIGLWLANHPLGDPAPLLIRTRIAYPPAPPLPDPPPPAVPVNGDLPVPGGVLGASLFLVLGFCLGLIVAVSTMSVWAACP